VAEDGKVLAWVARDPQFEAKEEAFSALPPEQRARRKSRRSTASWSISTAGWSDSGSRPGG
jgi:hypothetical protein